MSADPLAPLLELPGVTDAVTSSRLAVDGLLGHRVLRRRSSDVSAESLLRGAWASAVLAGSPVTLAELRAGTAEDPVLRGALRVSSALAGLAGTWPGAHRQVLARLHALAARGLAAESELGRPRADREVAHRLDVLAEVLDRTKAPAVVVAAIVQAELLSLDAFPPVSGVVARAAGRLVLIDRGLDPKSLVVVEVGLLELRSELEHALTDYAGGSPEAVAAWIELCAAAVVHGSRESLAICEAMQRG
ncbi:MAG TPA: oxidoreductase [Jatrophihabitans sp.]|nr:oxidoreductase [Jatrophihabitans sp.]